LANNSSNIKPDYFQFKLDNVDNSSFADYIGFDNLKDDYTLSIDDKNFIRLLYSEKNLSSNLNVGFKGNPNMGAIVLNQFISSSEFISFAESFEDGDAIFIINSIFGGTGAAGFPLLLNNLRENHTLPKYAKINTAPIGDITYLPYFSLNKKDEVNANSFEDKSKVALDYYNRMIIDKNRINSIYFIGNKGNQKTYEYAEGESKQRNDAHFLELAGAMAIFDFIDNIDKLSNNTQTKEFGILNNTETILFTDLENNQSKFISGHLTKFRLYTQYLYIQLEKTLDKVRWTKSDIKLLVSKTQNSILDKTFFISVEYKNQIEKFNNYFDEWIKEMSDNQPSFCPFATVGSIDALDLVKGKPAHGDKSFKELDIENCNMICSPDIKSSEHKKLTTLVKLFSRTTEAVLKNKKIINI